MGRARQIAAKILGALGWGILGGVLMYFEVGPWWVSWLPMAVAVCVIAGALDEALSHERGW